MLTIMKQAHGKLAIDRVVPLAHALAELSEASGNRDPVITTHGRAEVIAVFGT
jgi:hypothetical protein